MNLGSQRVARAVVSWLATVSGEDALLEDAVASREGRGREDASSKMEGLFAVGGAAEGGCLYAAGGQTWDVCS